MGRKAKDLTGKRFGKLIVKSRAEDTYSSGRKFINWYCNCDCGTKDFIVRGNSLNSNHTKSCGCLQKEIAKTIGNNNKKYNRYDLSGEYGIGYTTNTNNPFYFDLEDYEKIKDYCWFESSCGYIETDIKKTKKRINMHRLIMNCLNLDNVEVDHIKHNIKDNRKSQLRIATLSQNKMNQKLRSDNTSGVTGVSFYKNAWNVKIYKDKKPIYIGRYKNFKDAVNARREAEEKYYREYSYKNSMEI